MVMKLVKITMRNAIYTKTLKLVAALFCSRYPPSLDPVPTLPIEYFVPFKFLRTPMSSTQASFA